MQTLNNFRAVIAKIQRDAVKWLQETVPRNFHPTAADFNHTMHKVNDISHFLCKYMSVCSKIFQVLFLEAPEQYHKDNWPSESDRVLMFRLCSEVPVLQNTLVRLAVMGISKEHPISCPDVLDLMDRIIRRAASIQNEGAGSLVIEKADLYELMFGLCTYRYPENITLPQGYLPPALAITNMYWKAWILLLILAAHNPSTFGNTAWEKYPMLRALMEMCITNHFTFPPPTMTLSDEESKELALAAIEKQHILEFESHLAAASTKITITEQTSLLLSQLTNLDPAGPARKPPQATLTMLKTLNEQLHLGHRLCRSRRPDFLLDVIQRQGASQAMPWLADLVESSEGALR
jgi:integrator complex subunit 1